MEFDVRLASQANGVQIVDGNDYEKLKAELAARLETYKGLIVSEDGIKAAKKDRAALNRLRTAINDRVREIKRDYMQPFEEFKARADELIRMVDEPIAAIDVQVKGYEQRAKEEKAQRIIAFFDEHVGALRGCISLEQIWDKRWLNATFKEQDAYAVITDTLDNLSRDIEVIRGMKLPYEAEIIYVLCSTLNLSAALARKTEIEATAALLAEMQKQATQEPALEVPQETTPEVPQETVPEVTQEEPALTAQEPVHVHAQEEPQEVEQVRVIDFRIWATSSQLRELRKFLLENGIKYGRITD